MLCCSDFLNCAQARNPVHVQPISFNNAIVPTFMQGTSFHALIALCWVYWPRATSRKNKGMPAIAALKKYGMRKAPARVVRFWMITC